MRIVRLETQNVGGLIDCDLLFPDTQLVAFAGANGTGKSKLLACLLAPWTRAVPSGQDATSPSVVRVTFAFTLEEMDVLERFSREVGWGYTRPDQLDVTIVLTANPLGGVSITSEPLYPAAYEFASRSDVLKAQPSLNLVYLPAERRLLPPKSAVVDLTQLADDIALSKLTEARAAATNYGRLDDQEFESYARALCVAGYLPNETDSAGEEVSRWQNFKASVDALIYPKTLQSLTRENPSELRIALPNGSTHAVHDLSSGERQALIIISRVFRAGEGQSFIAIDEPDAYLHPSLSAKLLNALRPGLGPSGQLFVATHSPSILDSIAPESIFRLSHDLPPGLVESEEARLTLYREAGFRASALTQADALIITEGTFDSGILPQLGPTLSAVSFRAAGGRAEVIKTVNTLSAYNVPILGVVDADVEADSPPAGIADLVHVWPAADIEGVLLSSDEFLLAAIEGSLIAPSMSSLSGLRELLNELLQEHKDAAIAEYSQRLLRRNLNIDWPSPRGQDPIARLESLGGVSRTIESEAISTAIGVATVAWEGRQPSPWELVRGKWILPAFVKKVTNFRTAEGFVNAVVARRPRVTAIAALEAKVSAVKAGS